MRVLEVMPFLTAEDYAYQEGVDSVWDLNYLDSRDEHTRLALSDGENSIWVCDHCGELHDPDDEDGCECRADEEDYNDE